MKINKQRNIIFIDILRYNLIFSVGIVMLWKIFFSSVANNPDETLVLMLGLLISFLIHLFSGLPWILESSFHELSNWLSRVGRAQFIKLVMVCFLVGFVYLIFDAAKEPKVALGFLIMFMLSYLAPIFLVNLKVAIMNGSSLSS